MKHDDEVGINGEKPEAGTTDYNMVDIRVNGGPVQIALDDALNIGDISTGMSTVPSLLAYWGHVWATAEAEKMELEGHYKTWRARRGEELSAADGKLSEWKKNQAIESDDMYTAYTKSMALAERNAIVLRSVYEAFRVKASLLQSRAAMMRVELETTGMGARVTSSPEAGEARVSAMKQINLKKKQQQRALLPVEED